MLVAQVNQTRVGIFCLFAIPGSEKKGYGQKSSEFPNSIHPVCILCFNVLFQTVAVRLPALRMMGKAGL